MVVNNKIINSMITLGLTNYEAKAYCALLVNNPATAYEIAKESGIPSSKIYEVLSKLLEKKFIGELADPKKKYIPAEPGDIVEKFRQNTNENLDYLSTSLVSFKKKEDISYIWNISDYGYLLSRAEDLIKKSKKSLLVSIWKEEMKLLSPSFKTFQRNNKNLSIVHFGKPEEEIKTMFHHPIEDTIYKESGGRVLVIVSDSNEVLWGNIRENDIVDGAHSKNRGFTLLAEDYIKHDIYIMKIVKRFDKELIEKFGDNYKLLRDVFSDEEVL